MVHTTFSILMASLKEAGYTDSPDDILLCMEVEQEGVRSFVVIVRDHVDGGFLVSEWLRDKGDWLAEPHFDGTLEGCLEFVKHNY